MNLKKLARSALLLPVIVLSGCEEWKSDEQLIQNIWKEAVKITEIDPNTPMPQVIFLKKTEPKALGKFFYEYNKAEIYLGSITEFIWKAQDAYQKSDGTSGYDFSHKEIEASVYNTVAHEMLHGALYLKDVPGNLHHRQMKEKGYLLPVLSYINDYFKINDGFKSHRNGYHVNLSMQSLTKAIDEDEEEKREDDKKFIQDEKLIQEWKSDEQLIQNIWKEAVKITEIDPNTPMPGIVFLKSRNPKGLGRIDFNNKKAEIYLESIFRIIRGEQSVYNKFSFEDREALIYDIVAHEMLYYALDLKEVPRNHRHRQMKDGSYLLQIVSYINDYFKINTSPKPHQNGYHADLSMRILEKAIKMDDEEIAKRKKK
ncbi:MAG: hypothetical protein HYY86_02505 [Candidatus Harrisonbacteria bacterium]|nr:hypothetical protein [Candidatus Harrisonbacteria bacterium]